MTGLIYVTGDLHGDLTRLRSKAFKKLRRKDTLIVLGDFGFLWEGSKKERKLLKWLGKRKYHLLFLEGAHDNLNLLYQYPISDWKGGKVREISGKLRQLCRGSVFTLEEQKIFAFGGGESAPTGELDQHSDWWDKQLPSEEELVAARSNLDAVGWKVDQVVTHQSSRRLKQLLTMEDNQASVLDVFLDEVRDRCEYIGWYFGSYHLDRVIPPKEMAVFQGVIPLLGHFDQEGFGTKKRSR